MKKLLISLLIGAVLIGTGVGVTALEISDWQWLNSRPSLTALPVARVNEEFKIDVNKYDGVEVYLDYFYTGNNGSFRDEVVKVEKDENYKDRICVEIKYKGEDPFCNFYDYDNTDEGENTVSLYVDVISRGNFKEYKKIVEEMFENKVFYNHTDVSLIEKITVRTAYPEKITLVVGTY